MIELCEKTAEEKYDWNTIGWKDGLVHAIYYY